MKIWLISALTIILMTIREHFERRVVKRINDFGEIGRQLRQQRDFEQLIEFMQMVLVRFQLYFQHLRAPQNLFEFFILLMQFVNAQLKLIETVFHVVLHVEVLPEFRHNLMAQQIANVQHNCFAYFIQNIQSNQFVGHELYVVGGAFGLLELFKMNWKLIMMRFEWEMHLDIYASLQYGKDLHGSFPDIFKVRHFLRLFRCSRQNLRTVFFFSFVRRTFDRICIESDSCHQVLEFVWHLSTTKISWTHTSCFTMHQIKIAGCNIIHDFWLYGIPSYFWWEKNRKTSIRIDWLNICWHKIVSEIQYVIWGAVLKSHDVNVLNERTAFCPMRILIFSFSLGLRLYCVRYQPQPLPYAHIFPVSIHSRIRAHNGSN